MQKSVAIENGQSCSGCGACQAICPRKAVQLRINEDGFYQAFVNKTECIDCGLCQSVCIRFLPAKEGTTSMENAQIAGAYTTDVEIHQQTTSGGIAHELGKWGLENGYKLFGVVYDYKRDEAVSILVDNLEGLSMLRGSKYLQSDSAPALRTLLDNAKKNPEEKYICFGTPCQIFGLRQIIAKKKLKNEFILVDLFCHGVPSYLVWKTYIAQKKQELGTLTQVCFRYKGNGWHQYTINIKGEKKSYKKLCYRDIFYRFFFDNVALNTSCFQCSVRKSYVAADLRLGDFFGKNYENREDGVSAVLIATPKGQDILMQLQRGNRIDIDHYWSVETCLSAQSTKNYSRIELRNEVLKHLRKGESLSQVQRFYFSRLPLRLQVRSILKQVVSLLPNALMIRVRKMVRL